MQSDGGRSLVGGSISGDPTLCQADKTKQHRKALGHGDFKVNGGDDDFKVLLTN